jgi:hypothetical protein
MYFSREHILWIIHLCPTLCAVVVLLRRLEVDWLWENTASQISKNTFLDLNMYKKIRIIDATPLQSGSEIENSRRMSQEENKTKVSSPCGREFASR